MALSLPLLLAFLVAASRGDLPGDAYDTSICKVRPQICGKVSISYPFYIYGASADVRGNGDAYCGYPGLAIDCDYGKDPMLRLGDREFNVTDINYTNSTISLVDPDVLRDQSCPRVDNNVTVDTSSSPAVWLYLPELAIRTFIFFSKCSIYNFRIPGRPQPIEPITCASGSNSEDGLFSFVVPSEVPHQDLLQACKQVVRVPVLRIFSVQIDPASPEYRIDEYGNVLSRGFQLTWDSSRRDGPCSKCEDSSGRCAYGRDGEFMGCLCTNGRADAQDCANGSKSRTTVIAVSVAAAGVAFLAAAAFFVVMRKRKQKKVINSSSKLLKYSGSGGTPHSRGGDMESGSIQDLKTHIFSYEELEEATDCFNENRELGDGGFGTVYKGYLQDGRVVAVKRLYNNSYRRVEQFVNEAEILSRLRHPNLVMFYGCTSSQSRELLLVYEFVANGTVADHLHGHRAPERALSWPLRLGIAVESAAALTYLHAIEPPIVHRDVKTTNILLDSDFHVKVADFGLSRLFPLDVTHVSTAPQGTPGYVDPEYHQCYQLTDKSDVYSFGVVLVELISSKPAVDITRHRNEINLAGMAINKIQKCQLEQLVDLDLGYEADPATKKMMTMVAELAFRCLQQNGEMRPPIKEVLEVLRSIQGECLPEKDGDKHKDGPFSPNTVHAPWDSRSTTPNTSRD